MIGKIISHYHILEKLGEGGMGVVYRAEDTKLKRTVALKFLPPGALGDPELRARFLREAQSAAALSHPNVCTIYEVDEESGFLAMEFVEGETIQARIRRRPLPITEALEIAMQAAQGLQAAHERGVVHRDIKSVNLMVTPHGAVKIMDFGLAQLTGRTQLTKTGGVVGTASYMSPEQALGQTVDRRTDLWSLGVVLYEMVTARLPFPGDNPAAVAHSILHSDAEPVTALRAGLPLELDRVIAKALAKDPGDRYQHAEDFQVDVRRLKREAASGRTVWKDVAAQAWRRRAIVAAPLLATASFWVGRRTIRESHPSFHQLTSGRGSIWAARFAPDEQTIIYSARWDGNDPEVFSTRRDSSGSRSMLPNAELLSVSTGGELALLLDARTVNPFQRVGTLARTAIAGGATREIAERVSAADWEPGRGRLALVRGQSALEFPAGQQVHAPRGRISHVRFSQSGDRIAFLLHQNTDDGALVVFSLGDQRSNVWSDGWKSIWGLAWSPAGDEVWITGSRKAESRALYAVTPSGGLRLLFRETGWLTLHDVARDGRVLIARDDFKGGVLMLRKETSEEREVAAGSCLSMDLSPDGSAVLWMATDPRTGGPATYLRKTDGSQPVPLGEGIAKALSPDGKWALAVDFPSQRDLILHPTGPGQSRRIGGGLTFREASWFPDSRRILASASEAGKSGIYLIDVSGGQPRLVVERAYFPMRAHPVSPDGKAFFAHADDGNYRIYPLGEGPSRPIPGLVPGEAPVRWTPDGRSIFVQTRNQLPALLYAVDIAGGRRRLEKEFVQQDRAGTLSGSLLPSADGQRYAYQYARWLSELYVMDPS